MLLSYRSIAKHTRHRSDVEKSKSARCQNTHWARCRAAVGFDWHLVGIQVVARPRPAVSMPVGSLLGRRRLCWHSSGNPTSARCQYAHRVTVGPTPAMLPARRRSAVGPRIGYLSGQCWICSAYARHLLGIPTSARCCHFLPVSQRADARFNRHLVGMLSLARHQADQHSALGPITFCRLRAEEFAAQCCHRPDIRPISNC